ncbi:low specificity L-threonine aldolase [Sutterella seckii]|uniref:Aminotransferase class I/II-fold pyridoxal phosphate-dependent enzyme n=1 Tax=Sutterella seckii TaxID=1944635 RepID=A0A6I1EUW4_9BURK|nr:aminotransferase class I/II-fold pyridoxal phosphate-dependent enzyme [Sutterella seckii]KAB7662614.1 aminotransferase class I/II-fold pyridoxal phosphate-dependent enzyme [Sutterella seckii]
MIRLACDYQEGCLPAILERLQETNLVPAPGYGEDEFSENARRLIREACRAPEARVFFLEGGTQTNSIAIHAILAGYEGVLSAESGHIAVHEAGAVEARGHKVITLPQKDGKISAASIEKWMEAFLRDTSKDHVVQPGMVYISQPTEFGTLYSLAELEDISAVCCRYGLPLFIDGARMAYGLASEANDAGLSDIARLADVFYIGGTKCGALIGEALVVTNPALMKHFFTLQKQQGAVLAKGRLLGINFEVLMSGTTYVDAGRHGVELAQKIRAALLEKGYELYVDSRTNQIFAWLTDEDLKHIGEKAAISIWERRDDGKTLCRFCTSWATREEDVDAVIALL